MNTAERERSRWGVRLIWPGQGVWSEEGEGEEGEGRVKGSFRARSGEMLEGRWGLARRARETEESTPPDMAMTTGSRRSIPKEKKV